MAEKISGYTADATSNPIKNEDYLDFSNEDGGGGYDVSKKILVSELLTFLGANLVNVYNADDTLTGDRTITHSTNFLKHFGGDSIVQANNEVDDYGFLIQDSGGSERGRLGMNTTTGSGVLELSTLSGIWFSANDGNVVVNSTEFVVNGASSKVGIGTAAPGWRLQVVATGSNDGIACSNGSDFMTILPLKSSRTHFTTTTLGYHFNFGAGGKDVIFDSDETANILMFVGGSATGFDLGSGSGSIRHRFYTEGALDGTAILNASGLTTGDTLMLGGTNNDLFALIASTDNIGIGTNTPDASAIMEFSSTTKGVRYTPMTVAQAGAITPSEGLVLFVSDTDGTFPTIGLYCYENASWNKL